MHNLIIAGSESAPSGRSNRPLPPGLARLLAPNTSTSNVNSSQEQPLFQLCYEYKPFNSSAERKFVKLVTLVVICNTSNISQHDLLSLLTFYLLTDSAQIGSSIEIVGRCLQSWSDEVDSRFLHCSSPIQGIRSEASSSAELSRDEA